jgi:murein DD-endopeptidase MepM/ murein hydrolase activator NlpD
MILPAIRGSDLHGKGYFGASRAGGSRPHNGVDFVYAPGDTVAAFLSGTVSKLGYPYADKLEYRYVEVRRTNGDRVRYFYVDPSVKVGDLVKAGEPIGKCQALPYAGIIDHVHVECIVGGAHVDPVKYLSDNAP